MLRYLWLTRVNPYPPNYGGDMIYSSRLIEALSESQVQVTVLCHDDSVVRGLPAGKRDGVTWLTIASEPRPVWASFFSRSPSIAFRSSSAPMVRQLNRLLKEEEWGAIVLDNLAMGWALAAVSQIFARTSGHPKLVYLSHNHEESLRHSIAASYAGNPLKRLALQVDAGKAAALERAVVDAADLITVNTSADAELYRARRPDKSYLILTPGYDGSVIETRSITVALPRRAVIIGSFGWIAKQMNLVSFLESAASLFDMAGIELQVIGWMPDGFRTKVEAAFPSVDVVGTVDDFGPYLRLARLGIVPETLGGGFKHKLLQLAFNRVPIVAITRSSEGTPLIDGEHILEYPDVEQLAQGTVALMGDLERLNRLAEAAFAVCAGRFDWAERGRALATALAAPRLTERRSAA